jgi:hypothetical protein
MDNARLNFIPNQRQLSDSSHSSPDCNKTYGTYDQVLQSFIEMGRGHLVGKVSIGLSLKLIHYNAKNSSAVFARTSAGSFHDPQISASTDSETRLGQKLSYTPGLFVFRVQIAAFGAAKNGNNSFLTLAHFLTFTSDH